MWIACVVVSSFVRVTIGVGGEEPNGPSTACQISADGRLVLFSSYASNLVGGDVNHLGDAFLRDLDTERTGCLSCRIGDGDAQAVAMSPNGRYVGINTGLPNFAVLDRWTGLGPTVAFFGGDVSSSVAVGIDSSGTSVWITENRTGLIVDSIVAPQGGSISSPTLSRTGRLVGYQIRDYDGQSGTSRYLSYVLDRSSATTEQVDDGSGTGTGPLRISTDGRFVCYAGKAAIVLYDRTLGETTDYPAGSEVAMTPDARFIAWVGVEGRVHVLDRSTGAIQNGPQGRDPSLSDDGSRVAFTSDLPLDRHDTNGISDVYVWMR